MTFARQKMRAPTTCAGLVGAADQRWPLWMRLADGFDCWQFDYDGAVGVGPVRLRALEKDPLSPVTRAILVLIQALLPAMIDQGLNE
jgi:hypothetical protein